MPCMKFVYVCDKKKGFVVIQHKCFQIKACISTTTMIQCHFVLAAVDVCMNCILPQLTKGAELKLLIEVYTLD